MKKPLKISTAFTLISTVANAIESTSDNIFFREEEIKISKELKVNSYQVGTVDNDSPHVFLLAPKAGQGAQYWTRQWVSLETIYNTNATLYAVELGGTTTQSNENANELSVASQAQDLLKIIDTLHDMGKVTENIHIHCREFGCLIAQTALNLRSNFFKTALLESPLIIPSLQDPRNDVTFTNLCGNDDFCRRKFLKMHPNEAHSIIVTLAAPGISNDCAKEIRMAGIKGVDKLHEFVKPFLTGDIPSLPFPLSAQVAMAFLSTAHACVNIEIFRKGILPKMIQLFDLKSDNIDDSVNNATHDHLMLREVYQAAKDLDDSFCEMPIPFGLASPCPDYKKVRSSIFLPAKCEPTSFWGMPEELKTKLIIVADRSDLVTPFPPIHSYFKELPSTISRRFVSIPHHGHLPLSNPNTPCIDVIVSEFLLKGSSLQTDQCLHTFDKKLDWRMDNLSYGDWWAAVLPPLERPPGSALWRYTTIFCGSSAVLIVMAFVTRTFYRHSITVKDQ